MASIQKTSFILQPVHGRSFNADARFQADGQAKPVIIFVHGFKGFKDWGSWNLLADHVASQGFGFIKLNLSHNGTTPENDEDLHDMVAFGNNNFSLEMDDLDALLQYLESEACLFKNEIDSRKIGIIGHSRGGGLVLLKAAEDARLKAVVTWASVCDMNPGLSKDVIKKWKTEGVLYNLNSRTNMQMPLHYQLYEDYVANTIRFDVSRATASLQQPLLIIHGSKDPVVPVSCAEKLQALQPASELYIIENADHSFGGFHPYTATTLPADLLNAAAKTVAFFRKKL